jgi:hypothetical protein
MAASIPKTVLLLSSLLVLPCSYTYIISTNRKTNIITFAIVWSLIELVFYFYFINTRNRLQQTTKPKKPLNQQEREALFWNCVKSIHTIHTWAEGWFYYKKDYSHPQFKDIQRENLALWLVLGSCN